MKRHASGTYEMTSWDQAAYGESQGGPDLQRAEINRIFDGDFAGTSTAILLMCQSSDGGAGYIGSDHLVGTLHGRTGSFVVHHAATWADGAGEQKAGHIVPGSGRGELTGIRGEFVLTVRDGKHVYTADYEL